MTTPKFSFNAGTTPAATGATSGGLFGSALTSTPAAQQPTSFGFGASTTPQKPAFSTGFGTSTAAKPTSAFGSAFGTTATTTTTNTAAASPFSFGQKSATAATTTGAFGSTTQPAATNLFGNQTQSQAAQPQSSMFFNKTLQTGSAQPQTQQPSMFGNTTANTTLNATSAAETTGQPTDGVDLLANALVSAEVYNDERDLILAKWNQLQAFYGTGKVFYKNTAIDISKDNRLSRFKTISYNCKPLYKNENGLVSLIINQKEEAVIANQKNITDVLHKTFNSDQTLTVKIDNIKSCEDDSQTELVFYVQQRVNPMTEEKQRVSSMLVFNHLNKQEAAPGQGGSAFLSSLKTTSSIKQQLDQIQVVKIYPLVGLSDEQIKKYLDTPPLGFSPILWDLAKKNNPNAKKLLPVQITGFQEINKRYKLQNQENNAQKLTLNSINQKIDSLNARNKLIKTKIDQMKLQNEDLEQRILKIIINYEIRRKIGIPIQDAEKYLLNLLDSFQIELNSPINKEIQRQKFSEFTEIIKNLENSKQVKGKKQLEQQAANQLDELNKLGDIQKSLTDQQQAFKSLIDIINVDLKSLNLIKQGVLC